MAKRMNQIKEKSVADRVFGAVVLILSIITFIIIVYPLWFVIIASISNSNLVNQGKVIFWPKDINFYGFSRFSGCPYLERIFKYYFLCGCGNNLDIWQ